MVLELTLISEKLKIAEARIVALTVREFFLNHSCPSVSCGVLVGIYKRNRRGLLRNKVLTPLLRIIHSCCNYSDDVAEFRIGRHDVYMGACRELANYFDKVGIEYAVIKTVRDFPADIADIDMLVKPSHLPISRRALKDLGYRLRKISEGQELWSRVIDNVVVDVELHSMVSVAGFTYIESDVIFRNLTRKMGVLVPKDWLSVLIASAHAIIKDLEIRLSDMLELAFYLSKNGSSRTTLRNPIIDYASSLGLRRALEYMTMLTGSLIPMDPRNMLDTNERKRYVTGLPKSLPVKPPITIILSTLIEKALNKALLNGPRKVLDELLSILKTKGADAITAYLTGQAVTKDVFEDMIRKGDASD